VRFLDGDLRAYASQTLAMLDGHLPPHALNAVLDGLARSSGLAALSVTAAALRLTFPHGAPHPLPPFDELTEPQRQVVRILAGLGPETRRWGQLHLDHESLEPYQRTRRMPVYAGLSTLR
jgi:hypothetical protein